MTRKELDDFQQRVRDQYTLIRNYSNNIKDRWNLFLEVCSLIYLIPPNYIIRPGRPYRTKEPDWALNSYVALLWDKTGASPRALPENREFSPNMVERIQPDKLKYIARCVYELFTTSETELLQQLNENLERTDDEHAQDIIQGAIYIINNIESSLSIFESLE